MILVTFALPDESRPFAKRLDGLKRASTLPLVYSGTLGGTEILILHVGMGRAACEITLKSPWLQQISPALWIAAGVAGALNPKIEVARVFHIENQSTEPNPGSLPSAKMITRDEVVASAQGKQALHRETGADLIDMETEWIASHAAERRIPLLAIRSVSDDANSDFAVPPDVCFDTKRQRPRILALLTYLASHPSRIAPFARFVGNVGSATNALADALVVTIQEAASCKTKTV